MLTRPPSGSGQLTQYLRELDRELRRQRICVGPNMRRSVTPSGTKIYPVVGTSTTTNTQTGVVAVFL